MSDDFANGSEIPASRVVLCGNDTASIRQLAAARCGDHVSILAERDLRRVQLRSLNEVEPQAVSWLWPGYIAVGKLTILTGDPGGGKTWAMLDIAARLSRGDAMPDGTGGGDPVGVLFISYDDGVGDTLKVRTLGLGADPSKIVAIDGNYDGVGESRYISPEAIESVLVAAEDQERRMGCPIRLVVLDPLSAVLGGVDQNQSNAIYDKLGPLVTHCEAAGKALVCIDHKGKASPERAINLAIGSQGKAGLARLMATVVESGDDDGSRLLLSSKNSLGQLPGGMRFAVEDAPIRSVVTDPAEAKDLERRLGRDTIGTVRWLKSVPLTAQAWLDEQRQASSDGGGGLGSKSVEAVRVVLDCMGQGVRVASEIEQAVEQAGASWRTAQNAAKLLGIEKNKTSFGWLWRLPGEHPDAVLSMVRDGSP